MHFSLNNKILEDSYQYCIPNEKNDVKIQELSIKKTKIINYV